MFTGDRQDRSFCIEGISSAQTADSAMEGLLEDVIFTDDKDYDISLLTFPWQKA
jgi:hypothetical protein